MKSDKVLDAKGLACPMPIVRTKKAMNELESGQILEVHATDKGAKSDLAAWSKSGGHDLLEQTDEGDVLKFWIKKANECERVSNTKMPFFFERRNQNGYCLYHNSFHYRVYWCLYFRNDRYWRISY